MEDKTGFYLSDGRRMEVEWDQSRSGDIIIWHTKPGYDNEETFGFQLRPNEFENYVLWLARLRNYLKGET